jgi:hypothetical protein
MLELETGAKYGEDNTNEVEKDDNLTAEQQKKIKQNGGMK